MPDRSVDFLLIGGGVAAASCARELRARGGEGTILLVGREADPPYERPPLSKQYLRGDQNRQQSSVAAPEWWSDQRIELLTRTSVMKLDTAARVAKLSNREEVAFDKALIATGANVRRLRATGADLDGIHYLRAFANADAIRAGAATADHVVAIGGSYIGCEVAATLTAVGRRCTILMQEDVTLERHFGRNVGRYVHDLLESHGVEILGGEDVTAFEGDGDRVAAITTMSGRHIDCDCVVVGVGVAPDVMLARAAGLELGEGGGVACSAQLETSAPGVFAAGDVAEFDSPLHGGPARVEHHEAAIDQGRTAAANMLGASIAHEAVPYFWSDISNWLTLEYVGIPAAGDGQVRGNLASGDCTVFWLDAGRLVGALSLGRADDLAHARRLIAERATPDPSALRDEGVDLGAL